MRFKWMVAAAALGMTMGVAKPALAGDTLLSPFYGVTFGGDATQHRPVFGGSATFFGAGAGLEIEAARAPKFFGKDIGENSLTSLTGAFVVGGDPRGNKKASPYFLVGAGLVRTNVDDAAHLINDVHFNDFAIVLGGGVNAMLSYHVGIRGDVRYYRKLSSASENGVIPFAGTFDFWRGTVGLALFF